MTEARDRGGAGRVRRLGADHGDIARGRMAELVRDNLETLAGLLTFEQGKPLAEARAEMTLGADHLRWFAEEARRINGENVPSPWPDRQILVARELVGVV